MSQRSIFAELAFFLSSACLVRYSSHSASMVFSDSSLIITLPTTSFFTQIFCSVYRGAYLSQQWDFRRMDLRDTFAANLRRLRNAKGLSQDDLAYEAEVSRSYLSQLEKGKFYASLQIIGKLAQALNVEPVEFLKTPKQKAK
ncbi:MAG: helix-turn-helix transcriptional regulator [Alphaproteobacteria bacterium]